jgi:hypothetical protein
MQFQPSLKLAENATRLPQKGAPPLGLGKRSSLLSLFVSEEEKSFKFLTFNVIVIKPSSFVTIT